MGSTGSPSVTLLQKEGHRAGCPYRGDNFSPLLPKPHRRSSIPAPCAPSHQLLGVGGIWEPQICTGGARGMARPRLGFVPSAGTSGTRGGQRVAMPSLRTSGRWPGHSAWLPGILPDFGAPKSCCLFFKIPQLRRLSGPWKAGAGSARFYSCKEIEGVNKAGRGQRGGPGSGFMGTRPPCCCSQPVLGWCWWHWCRHWCGAGGAGLVRADAATCGSLCRCHPRATPHPGLLSCPVLPVRPNTAGWPFARSQGHPKKEVAAPPPSCKPQPPAALCSEVAPGSRPRPHGVPPAPCAPQAASITSWGFGDFGAKGKKKNPLW